MCRRTKKKRPVEKDSKDGAPKPPTIPTLECPNKAQEALGWCDVGVKKRERKKARGGVSERRSGGN